MRGFLWRHKLYRQANAARNICHAHKFNGVRRIVVITGRQKKGNRIPQPVNNGMDFRVQTAFRASDSLIFRFFPTIRTFMDFMDFNASRINTEILSISISTQLSKNFLPNAIIPPLGKTSVNALPGSIAFWKLPPLRSAVIHP